MSSEEIELQSGNKVRVIKTGDEGTIEFRAKDGRYMVTFYALKSDPDVVYRQKYYWDYELLLLT